MVKLSQADRRKVWDGFGSGLQMAVELAVVPLLFGLLGAWLDRTFGTKPALTLTLLCFAFVGTFVKAYYEYAARVREEEREKPWNRSTR
jgi:hypothetical protein